MANLYLSLDNLSITNIDTKERTVYNSFFEAFNVAIDGRNKVFIYDLYKVEKAIVNYLVGQQGYTVLNTGDLPNGIISELTESKTFFTVGSKAEKTCILVKIRKTKNKVTKVENAKAKFGKATIAEIASKFDCEDNEDLGMAYALEWLLSNGHDQLTLAGNAFKDLKLSCFGRQVDGQHKYAHFDFAKLFPKLDNEKHDFFIKNFQNGLCIVNEDYAGHTEVAGTSYDVNSMYPSVMKQEALPYGQPIYFKGKLAKPFVNGEEVLHFQRIKVAKMTLKEGCYPVIKDQTTDKDDVVYYTEAENIELNLTNVAMKELFRNYDVEGIEYIDGYKFRRSTGMFNAYIDKWMEQKKNAAEGSFERMYAKLMLNSAFGKFVSRNNRLQSEWKLSKFGQSKGRMVKQQVKDKTKVEGSSVYAPVGCFITDYARTRLLDAIYANKDNFMYSDTDSIYLEGEATGLNVDDKELGAWKEEIKFSAMNIIGKKQYCVQKEDGSIKVVLAGCPDDAKGIIEDYDDFFLGQEIPYTYTSYDLEGNRSIEEAVYNIKELENYTFMDKWQRFIKNN